jgi:hypothetical protein
MYEAFKTNLLVKQLKNRLKYRYLLICAALASLHPRKDS